MSETANKTATKIVWFELPADDTQRARGFYGDLFGWSFQPMDGPIEYHMSSEAGGAIQPANGRKGLLAYFGVDDIDSAIARVNELGGNAADKQQIPGVGFYALCTDTEGNTFGLYEASS